MSLVPPPNTSPKIIHRQICTCGKAVPFLDTMQLYVKEDPDRTLEQALDHYGCRRLCCRKTVLCNIDPAPRAGLLARVLQPKPDVYSKVQAGSVGSVVLGPAPATLATSAQSSNIECPSPAPAYAMVPVTTFRDLEIITSSR